MTIPYPRLWRTSFHHLHCTTTAKEDFKSGRKDKEFLFHYCSSLFTIIKAASAAWLPCHCTAKHRASPRPRQAVAVLWPRLLQGPPRASLDAKILNYANDDARQYIHYSIHIYEVVHASSSSLCQCLANRQPLPTSTLMPKGRGCELAASRLETSGSTVGPNDKNPPKN